MNDNPPRNWKRIGLTVLLLVASGLSALLIISGTNQNIRFDANLWYKKSSPIDGSNFRLRMVNDIQRNILHRGMPRTEIESLLGKGDFGFFTNDYDIVYRLGSEPVTGTMTRYGQSIQSGGQVKWLGLTLDPQERLVDWRIIRY